MVVANERSKSGGGKPQTPGQGGGQKTPQRGTFEKGTVIKGPGGRVNEAINVPKPPPKGTTKK